MLQIETTLLERGFSVLITDFGVFLVFAFLYLIYLQIYTFLFSRKFDKEKLQQVQAEPVTVKNFIFQMRDLILESGGSIWKPFFITLTIFFITSFATVISPEINQTFVQALGAFGVMVPVLVQTNWPKRAESIFEQVTRPM